ncbi:MAG TPA: hypothetical protein VM012_00055, partial [Flavitalea sp.]|nr:hypothetical protein [Flavitalea sp.]
MRLQEKYNRATIAIVILVLFIAGIGYYFLIHQALIDELDEALKVEEQEISHLIRTTGTLPEESEFRDQKIQFEKASGPVVRKFISTKAYNEKEQETVILRQLIFPVTVHSGIYKVIVTKSQREVEDLLILILLITASIILLLLILLFFANRILLKKLWKPFFSTLSVINDFHLSKPINKNLPATDIDEFSALNDAWQRVTTKITTDYETVKSFADNASHEMQTPLAIINSKLDLLIQGHALNGENVQHLQSM